MFKELGDMVPLYTPLDDRNREIRLLPLRPELDDAQGDVIQCTFSTVSLNQPSQYEALSYVWGSIHKEKTIEIDGQETCVTNNLYNALHRLRLRDQERTLWVDAVCINQTDIAERTHQVGQMRLVYERAERVVVYLGEPWPGCDEAMEFIEITGSNADLHYSPALEPHVRVRGLDISSAQLRDHIIQFFDLEWWKRVWTVQEFVLARNVIFHCGQHILAADVILKCFENVNIHDNTCCADEDGFTMQSEALGMCVWEGFTRIDLLAYMRSAKKPQSFLQTLGSVRGRRCHDERDKVYGMLGLASGEWEGFVEVDYSKETEEVYRDVATAAAQRTGRLDFLSFCYGARGEGVKVPSFVPDWTASIDGVGHAAYLSRTFSISDFNAAHGVKAEWRLIEPEAAVFKGVAFDRVTVIGETQNEDSITTAEILDSWLRVAKVGDVDFSSDEWDTRRVAEGSDELPDAEKRI